MVNRVRNFVRPLILAAALPFALAVSTASAATPGGAFVDFAVGQARIGGDIYGDNSTSYSASGGYRWALSSRAALGFEVGFTDLGSFSAHMPPGLPADFPLRDASVKGWTAGVNGRIDLTPEWYLQGRVGLLHADVKGSYWLSINPPLYLSYDDSGSNVCTGVAVGYDINRNLGVELRYDYYHLSALSISNPSQWAVGLEYRF